MAVANFNRLRTGDDVRVVLGNITASAATNITAASNATPIVVTSAAHGLKTGDDVIVAGVAGNTAANGVRNVTVVDANNFSINGSVGNGAYTSGGTAQRIFTSMTVAQLLALEDAANRVNIAPSAAVSALAAFANI